MIFVIFKLFSRYKINTLHAIVVNYIVACISGLIAFDGIIIAAEIPHFSWFYYTLGLGAFFIIVFNLMAITTQRCGLSVVSVATKMSLAIPIVFGLLYYKEQLGVFNGLGIVLALIAVYLASVKTSNGPTVQKNYMVLPLLVFLGSGIIDASIKFLEESFVAENDVPLFSATIFGSAASVGILVLVFQYQCYTTFSSKPDVTVATRPAMFDWLERGGVFRLRNNNRPITSATNATIPTVMKIMGREMRRSVWLSSSRNNDPNKRAPRPPKPRRPKLGTKDSATSSDIPNRIKPRAP